MVDTVESLDKDIADLSAQVDALHKKINRKYDKRQKMLLKQNQHHFGDIEWLINNPDTPGQYEALQTWVKSRFGEFMGVHPSGYYPDISQQAFSIMLHDRWRNEDDGDDTEVMVTNAKAFLTECLGYFKPNSDGFVSFNYMIGEHSGVFQLSYRPETQSWWTRNIRYHHVREEREYPDLDAAILAAQEIARSVTD
jgi:hypothetical protein